MNSLQFAIWGLGCLLPIFFVDVDSQVMDSQSQDLKKVAKIFRPHPKQNQPTNPNAVT